MRFESSNDVLTIRQTFTGQDAQGHMRMMTVLDGRIPAIADDAQVEIDDYYEEYHRMSPGMTRRPVWCCMVQPYWKSYQCHPQEMTFDSWSCEHSTKIICLLRRQRHSTVTKGCAILFYFLLLIPISQRNLHSLLLSGNIARATELLTSHCAECF